MNGHGVFGREDGDFGAILLLAHLHLGCDAAGVAMRGSAGSAVTLATSHPLVRAADQLQGRHADGPAVSPVWPAAQITVAEVTHAGGPWQAWTRALAPLGIVSVLATQVLAPPDRTGSLTLYYRRPVEIQEVHLTLASLLARHASEHLRYAEQVVHLQTALRQRTVLGQAQGLLMERFGITADRADAILVGHSRASDTTVQQVAELLLLTGRLEPVGAVDRS